MNESINRTGKTLCFVHGIRREIPIYKVNGILDPQ